MENGFRAFLLYARLVDLNRRKTEAELINFGTKVYDALIELYELELAEIEKAEQARKQRNDPEGLAHGTQPQRAINGRQRRRGD